MQSSPLVSFVIPCYNYGRYLAGCLNSIFGQEGSYDFEVIVIDDGSTDNTSEVLSSFSDPRLKVIRHATNLGHVAVINEGLSLARGVFIARIDPDDRYRPYFLSTVLGKFYDFPEVGLVYADAALINEQGEVTLEHCDRVHGNQDFKGNELIRLLENNFICSPTVIARQQAWRRALPVPAGLAFHDWYFTLMMAREYEFYYINRVLADYRVHPLNFHDKIMREKKEESSVFWLLDRIFTEVEKKPDLESQKLKFKRCIYSAQYFALANRYFGFGMQADARRCYLQAIRYRPSYLFKFTTLRFLAATSIGLRQYESFKRFYKRSLRFILNR